MVEAPRIRIIYEKIRSTKGQTIVKASGSSYKKIAVDLLGYTIRKLWHTGKYIYIHLVKDNYPSLVVRTHMMMYGKIIINNESEVNPKLRPFMVWELSNGTILAWYLTQIKILDPNCATDQIKSNYTICSSKQNIEDSIRMMKYDISNKAFDVDLFIEHIHDGIKKYPDDIIVDFLLNQEYFPGVGNILQQEVLYRCKILPTKTLFEIDQGKIVCLVNELRRLVNDLYQSYLDKLQQKTYKPILQIYHKKHCPVGHKTITKYLGYHIRRTTWCPICQK